MIDFLPYNMPETFSKTGYGLTNIITAWDAFSPVLHPDSFLGITVHIPTVC